MPNPDPFAKIEARLWHQKPGQHGLFRNFIRRCHNPSHFNLRRPSGVEATAIPSRKLATERELSLFLQSVEKRAFKRSLYHVRDEEAAYALRGIKRWTFAVEHVASGAFVGISEVFQSAGKPHVLQQGITAIGKDHRGHGLGWWVKLAAIKTIMTEAPDVTVIRTENAVGNAGIAHINAVLGFKVTMEETIWQVSLDDLTKFVDERQSGSACSADV